MYSQHCSISVQLDDLFKTCLVYRCLIFVLLRELCRITVAHTNELLLLFKNFLRLGPARGAPAHVLLEASLVLEEVGLGIVVPHALLAGVPGALRATASRRTDIRGGPFRV